MDIMSMERLCVTLTDFVADRTAADFFLSDIPARLAGMPTTKPGASGTVKIYEKILHRRSKTYMSRYTGPKFKLSRRLGISLSGTGKELKRPFPPGQHGPGQRRKVSGYGIQLQEKQKLRHMYGLNEKQFRNLFVKASKLPGISGENFMVLLESRLDNLVYRLGFANSRAGARQLVSHGHVTVNGHKVNIASYIVKPGDVIGLRERSRNLASIKDALANRNFLPNYLEFNEQAMEGKYVRLPERSELPAEIDEKQIVEFYSR
jgi:small subunit ribosomal protein S4